MKKDLHTAKLVQSPLSVAKALLLILCVALPTAFDLGCGSVSSQSAIGDALLELDEARGLGAEDNAPYEYTSAFMYLQKAKKLNGQGQYEQASEYASKSREVSKKAVEVTRLALDRAKRMEKFAPKKKDDDTVAPKDAKAKTKPMTFAPTDQE